MANTYEEPINFFETTLNGALAAGGTSAVLTDIANADSVNLPANTYLTIDSELVYVSAVNTGTKTVTIARGEGGTSDVAHSSGATVIQPITSQTVDDLRADRRSYVDTQAATVPALVTAGASAGTAAANAGNAETAARSDHIHFMTNRYWPVYGATTALYGVTGARFVRIVARSPMLGPSLSIGYFSEDAQYCTYLYNYDTGGGEYALRTGYTDDYCVYLTDGSSAWTITFDSFGSGSAINVTVSASSVFYVYLTAFV